MSRLLWLVLLPCLTAKPRRPRQQEEPPWLTDAYLPEASKFPPAHQPNNNQRGRREATRLARADAITHQVAVHRGDPGREGWGPFRLIEVDGFIGGRSHENLYFGAVNAVAGYLLGLFPLSSPSRHAIVAAFSCDGIHFSRFVDVAPAGDAGAGRTFHQPFDGLVVERGRVYAYVQENVRGLDMDRHDDDPDYPTGPPRVVRYGTTLVALERRAIVETRGLAGCWML